MWRSQFVGVDILILWIKSILGKLCLKAHKINLKIRLQPAWTVDNNILLKTTREPINDNQKFVNFLNQTISKSKCRPLVNATFGEADRELDFDLCPVSFGITWQCPNAAAFFACKCSISERTFRHLIRLVWNISSQLFRLTCISECPMWWPIELRRENEPLFFGFKGFRAAMNKKWTQHGTVPVYSELRMACVNCTSVGADSISTMLV